MLQIALLHSLFLAEYYFVVVTNSMTMNLSKLWEMVMDREAWLAAVLGVTKGQTGLSD